MKIGLVNPGFSPPRTVYFLLRCNLPVSPSPGWLVDRTENYVATFFLSGVSYMLSSVVLAAAMLVRRCRKSKSNSPAHLAPNHSAAAAQQGVV